MTEIVSITVCGIPAQARVTSYLNEPGRCSPWTAHCPEDVYGYRECEFDILDRRGRPAPWLEAKMDRTNGERERVEDQVLSDMEARRVQAKADAAYERYQEWRMGL